MYYFGTQNQQSGDWWYRRGNYDRALESYRSALETLYKDIAAKPKTDPKIYYPLAYVLLEIAITLASKISKIDTIKPITQALTQLINEFDTNFLEAQSIFINSLTGEEAQIIEAHLNLALTIKYEQLTTVHWNRTMKLMTEQTDNVYEQHRQLEQALKHVRLSMIYGRQLNQMNDKERKSDLNAIQAFEGDIHRSISILFFNTANDKDLGPQVDNTVRICFLKNAVISNRKSFKLFQQLNDTAKTNQLNQEYEQMNQQLQQRTNNTALALNNFGTFRHNDNNQAIVPGHNSNDSNDSMDLC